MFKRKVDYFISYDYKSKNESGVGDVYLARCSIKFNIKNVDKFKTEIRNYLFKQGVINPSIVILNVIKL